VRATIVDAVGSGIMVDPVLRALGELGALTVHHLDDERFAPCLGCFECWTTHPGTCRAKDGANPLMRDVITADEVIWLVRPRFGCWSAEAKQALDKLIGLISPFFSTVHGETHHRPRYPRYPRFGVVAWAPPDAGERDALRLLVARNAVNLQSTDSWVAFVEAGDTPEQVAGAITRARADGWRSFPELASPPVRPGAVGVRRRERPRRALLWVGSAKPVGTSTSEHLGRGLLDRLERRGWLVDVVYTASVVRVGRAENPRLAEAVGAADLVVLASPVYVDCLPALVLAGLASLVGHAASAPTFVPILQCGFPERTHVTLALEIVERAVQQLGGRWGGHLDLGGATPYATADLASGSGMAADQAAALELAADALDRGEPVPAAATERFARSFLGPWSYRVAGQVSWVWEGWRRGGIGSLGARPFDP
jgi:hypothetical protein